MDIYLLMLIAVCAGAAGRTLYHYLFKVLDNPGLAFDKKYIVTMLIAVLMTIMSSPLLLLNVTIPQGSDGYIAIATFAIGWTSNDVLNPPVSLAANTITKLKELVNNK